MSETPARPKRVPVAATVLRTSWTGPSMVRVVFGGADLARFPGSDRTDAYVKLVFLHPGAPYDRPLDVDAVKAALPSEQWPRLRTYTVRAWDPAANELTIDLVVHGDEGLAGPWAARAAPGDELHLLGPGGGYAPDPAADWHLLVGDESALPAIAAAAEALPPDATGHLVVEVDGVADEQPLTVPAGVAVRWVHRAGRPVGAALVEVVANLELPAGTPHAFVHGEAGFVKDLRRLLRVERGIAKEQLAISGYWRKGADDEGWRAQKRQWNAEVEAAEAAAGVA